MAVRVSSARQRTGNRSTFVWFHTPNEAACLISAASLVLQVRTATRPLASPSTPMSGVVPSSRTAPRPLLVAGRTTRSATEASVRTTGTDRLGRTDLSLVFLTHRVSFLSLLNPLTLKCSVPNFNCSSVKLALLV